MIGSTFRPGHAPVRGGLPRAAAASPARHTGCNNLGDRLLRGVAGTLFTLGAIKVFIAAEDHPPPHVHAFHQGEGWTARFRFSFLSDVTGLYRFHRRGRRPTDATLEAVADAVTAKLPVCREAWWHTHGTRHGIGLINRPIETRTLPATTQGDPIRAKVALAPGAAAVAIVSAAYSPANGKVALALADGRKLILTAGQHIEEAAEW